MDSALIYNPAFGTEESVEEQVVFSYGQSAESRLTQLGVAQGVVELAHTFDGNPVSWLRTATHLVIVRQLEATNPENWRHGFWFTCMLRLDAALPTQPDSFAQIVSEAYRRWALHNGPLGAADRQVLERWWHAFCENWTGINESGAAGACAYLRIKPGLLSPSAVRAASDVLGEIGARDMLVTAYDDAGYIWSGSSALPYDTKLALQLWLAECAIAEDTAYAETSGYVYHLRKGFCRPEPAPTTETVPEAAAESSWWTLRSLALPSMSLPTMSMPSMPSLPSLWPASETPAPPVYPETGFVETAPVQIDGRTVHLAVYRRNMFIYTLLFDATPRLGVAARRSLDRFAEQLEGFNFAAAPPASFDYLVVDHAHRAVHSTLDVHDHALQETVAAVLRAAALRPQATEQIARTAANWWTCWLRLDAATEAVFCNRWSPLDTKSLFGPLSSEAQRWLRTYMPHLVPAKGAQAAAGSASAAGR